MVALSLNHLTCTVIEREMREGKKERYKEFHHPSVVPDNIIHSNDPTAFYSGKKCHGKEKYL